MDHHFHAYVDPRAPYQNRDADSNAERAYSITAPDGHLDPGCCSVSHAHLHRYSFYDTHSHETGDIDANADSYSNGNSEPACVQHTDTICHPKPLAHPCAFAHSAGSHLDSQCDAKPEPSPIVQSFAVSHSKCVSVSLCILDPLCHSLPHTHRELYPDVDDNAYANADNDSNSNGDSLGNVDAHCDAPTVAHAFHDADANDHAYSDANSYGLAYRHPNPYAHALGNPIGDFDPNRDAHPNDHSYS